MTALAAILTVLSPQALDIPRLTECCRLAENTPLNFVSRDNCRGEYQLGPTTWKQHSEKPFLWAITNTPEARKETKRVAEAHVKWIVESALPLLKLPVSPYSVALCYRIGYGNLSKLKISDEAVGYARRVVNLYEEKP